MILEVKVSYSLLSRTVQTSKVYSIGESFRKFIFFSARTVETFCNITPEKVKVVRESEHLEISFY